MVKTLEDLARLEDAQAIVRINQDSWLGTYVNEELGITEEAIRQRFSNMDERVARMRQTIETEQNDEKRVYVSRNEEGVVVGYVILERGKDYHSLKSIYVSPDYQSQGIGKRLLNAGIKWLGEEKPLRVEVTAHNQKAIDFYKRMGFEDTGERKQAPVVSGVTMTDCVFERK